MHLRMIAVISIMRFRLCCSFLISSFGRFVADGEIIIVLRSVTVGCALTNGTVITLIKALTYGNKLSLHVSSTRTHRCVYCDRRRFCDSLSSRFNEHGLQFLLRL